MQLKDVATIKNRPEGGQGPIVSDFKLLRASTLKINPNVQQRETYDPEDIKDFAGKIKAARDAKLGIEGTGYEQPINVYVDPTGQSWVTFGGRRTMAGQCAEVWGDEDPYIPALVSQEIDEKQAALSSIIENEDRVPPTPMEQTNSYMRLYIDFGMSPQEIAVNRNWSESTVNEILNRAGYGKDLKELMATRPDTKRIAREIHNKVGDKDAAFRRELIEEIANGLSYENSTRRIRTWEDGRKTAEAVKVAESASIVQSVQYGSSTSLSSPIRPTTPAIAARRNNTFVDRSPSTAKPMPRTPYSTLARRIEDQTRDAWDVCQNVPPPPGAKRKELIQAAEAAIKNLENLIKICQAGNSTNS